MVDAVVTSAELSARPKLDVQPNMVAIILFLALLAVGILFTAYSLQADIAQSGMPITTWLPYPLLGVALLIALGFEFVNGFHDTANAVATVIYTHSMPANVAVVWSGFFNFLGVMLSSGAVAFGIISLLPVELILQVGSGAGFAMVFALLIAAIIWNLGTWWLGLPASSSHTLIGSIIGVGIANALMRGTRRHLGRRLEQGDRHRLLAAAVAVVRLLHGGAAAAGAEIRGAQSRLSTRSRRATSRRHCGSAACSSLTCTGVSFAHGSNDGQKGMGLIMLILIGVVPTAYALNRTPAPTQVEQFKANADCCGRSDREEDRRPPHRR